MTEDEVKQRIQGLDDETAKSVVCALLGHSKIQDQCMGYWSCGRCGAQVGDSLGGSYSSADVVLIGHNCATCQINYANLGWKHKFMAPHPFKAEDAA